MKRSELNLKVGDVVTAEHSGMATNLAGTRVETGTVTAVTPGGDGDGTTFQVNYPGAAVGDASDLEVWYFPDGVSNVVDFGVGHILSVNGEVVTED